MVSTAHVPEKRPGHQKWSRLYRLAKGAAIAQCNRERASQGHRCGRGNPWTADEITIVKETYPNYRLMLRRLPHRTLSGLKGCAQSRGIAKKKHVWTTAEIAILRTAAKENWGRKRLCGALPYLRPKQIYAQFLQRGFKYNKPPKVLGIPVVDEVRARAHKMNLSLADLDAIAGRGAFWQNCIHRPQWRRICRVIEFMGGQLRVEFPLDCE